MPLKHTRAGEITKYLKIMKNNTFTFRNDITILDPTKKISDLTVEEYLSLHKVSEKKYEYGIKGIAKIFGCGRTKAQKIKKSGDIDGAIFQNKNTIVIDVDRALELFAINGK